MRTQGNLNRREKKKKAIQFLDGHLSVYQSLYGWTKAVTEASAQSTTELRIGIAKTDPRLQTCKLIMNRQI